MPEKSVKPETLDFLFSSYFGIELKELKGPTEKKKKDIAFNCAYRAYRDLCRTLTFIKESTEKDRRKFREEMSGLICKGIEERILTNCSDFDTAHENICEELIKKAERYGLLKSPKKKKEEEPDKGIPPFTYGHAQKWLNMTIKYMWLLGLWDEELQRIKDKLHIPVDRYILKAASSIRTKGEVNKYGLEFKKVPLEHKYDEKASGYTEFREEKTDDDKKSQPWSQWNESDYEDFIKEINDRFKKFKEKKADNNALNPIDSLIEWENKAWIEQARLEDPKKVSEN